MSHQVNPFFKCRTRSCCCCDALYDARKRDGGGAVEQICNRDLVDWFERSLAEDYRQMVQKYPDLSNVNLYLGDGKTIRHWVCFQKQ